MSLYKHVREMWKKPQTGLGELWRERRIAWRKEPATVKIDHPTRIDRARSLGFKAKQGYVMVRQRVGRGGFTRPFFAGGRKPSRFGKTMNLRKNYQQIAEERAQKKYPNLVLLNSYWVARDGMYFWYEAILVDPNHPVIKADEHINWICEKKNQARVFHGRTSVGRKTRGMGGKGEGYEKARPSRRANLRRQ
jgi:large subunit ribosomal protein L15e